MQASIEVSQRGGDVFFLDILSHRMSEMPGYINYPDCINYPQG
jgi:hypothetical protein